MLPSEVQGKILEWKKDYGSVFLIEVEESIIVYRGLTVKETVTLERHGKLDAVAEEGIINFCVLYPEELKFHKPGSYSSLAEHIRNSSSWWEEDSLLTQIEAKKEKLQTDAIKQICIELSKFFGYSVDRLESMTFEHFVEHCAIFELMTGQPLMQQPSTDDKHNEVLRKLGVHRENAIELERPITAEEYLRQQGMQSASQSLAEKISEEQHKEPSKIFNWEKDLQDYKNFTAS
jgi:hypothetical protein